MSRRSGQSGYVEKKGNAYYVRFWMDVPGQEERKHMSVRLCPLRGLGKLTKSERERKAREVIAASGADTEQHFKKVEAENLGVTFRQQAEWWLQYVQTRKRKPIKPHTAMTWRSHLTWINPRIGDVPLESVNNLTLKELVSNMSEAGFSPKTMHNYIQVVKMVVASAVNEHGEEIYPRKWNHEFIDLPESKNLRTPIFTAEEITQIVAESSGQYQMLYALLGGTGLRIGEALGLEIEDISPDGAFTIRIRQSIWHGRKQSPKTPSAVREVDLHSSLAAMLKAFIGDRKSGFIFRTRNGKPLSHPSVLKQSLHRILNSMGKDEAGFHGFRRFRVTHLRKSRVPEDLLRFWIGHADKSVTDGYSKVKEDIAFRRLCAQNVGFGFQLPEIRVEKPTFVPSCTLREPISDVS